MSSLSTSSLGSTSQSVSPSVSGLVSGIDTQKVIEGLLAIEQSKITRIDQKKSKIVQQQTAYKAIEARLLALQGQMTQLSRSQNSVFDGRTVTSSDTNAVTAAATSSAVAGVYRIQVNSLARAQQIASQGFDSTGSTITQGTFTIKVGDNATDITIDSSNNTLQGLADAINNSGAKVSAAIINDGSGANAQGYRLLLTSAQTGAANKIILTNSLAGSAGGDVKPLFDSASIGSPILGTGFTGTSTVGANTGSAFTGSANTTYRFTVVTGGTVGTDDGLQLAYTDSTGAHTGTITVNQGDADSLLSVAEGVQVKFGSGTLIAGQTFDVKAFVPNVQDATDAAITLGSGSGALTVTSATNQFDSVLPGIALNVLQAAPNSEITLTVANDIDKMAKAVTDFVSSYNDVMDFINQASSFDSTTGQAGILLGDRRALTIQDQVRSVFTGTVDGANPRLSYLGGLGITTDDKGKLTVNDAKLADVLNGKLDGVTLADVKTLFSLTGKTSNTGIQFVTGSTKTKTTSSGYTVRISQAAQRATLTGATDLAASTVIDGTNNLLSVTIDGKPSAQLTIAAGTYSRIALAQAVQTAINSDTTLAGASVNVTLNGDKLAIASNRLGVVSQVLAGSGSSLAALGFSAGASAQGADVVGDFLVNGVSESARGTGQFLAGDPENANTADLQLRVILTPAQVGTGIESNVTVSRGVASRLDTILNQLFDPINGRLKTIDDDFTSRITDLDDQKSAQSQTIASRTASLQRQFAAMEETLSKLQASSGFLSSQSSSVRTSAS